MLFKVVIEQQDFEVRSRVKNKRLKIRFTKKTER